MIERGKAKIFSHGIGQIYYKKGLKGKILDYIEKGRPPGKSIEYVMQFVGCRSEEDRKKTDCNDKESTLEEDDDTCVVALQLFRKDSTLSNRFLTVIFAKFPGYRAVVGSVQISSRFWAQL